eukprot:scaffold9085_cov215-Amphora_coffeaeformis.AAC.11
MCDFTKVIEIFQIGGLHRQPQGHDSEHNYGAIEGPMNLEKHAWRRKHLAQQTRGNGQGTQETPSQCHEPSVGLVVRGGVVGECHIGAFQRRCKHTPAFMFA